MATTVETNYTFNGTTISFSDAQQAILNQDIIDINNATDNLTSLLKTQGDLSANEAFYDARNPKSQDDYYQLSLISTRRTENNNDIASAQKSLDASNPLSLISKYNNDLIAAQDQIKLQIQTQQSNQATANANTQNQVVLNQNSSPAIQQANALNAQAIQQQAQLDAESSATTKKYIFFGVVVIVVVLAIIVIIRKLL